MTASMTAGRLRPAARQALRLLGAATFAVALAACDENRLALNNLNTPAESAINADARLSAQLRATGLFALERDLLAGFISDAGILGRESLNYTPTENRNTTEYLGSRATANNSFNTGNWTARYRSMRSARDLVRLVDRADNNTLTTAERAATRGFANTMWALSLYYVIASRDTLGAVVDIIDTQDSAATFVRRDSVYRFILSKLDGARTDLLAGGGSFPFPVHSGFSAFSTPATFAQFNRALYARVAATLASFTRNTTTYQAALTAVGQTWVDAAPGADLRRGAFHVFSAASGDNLNNISTQVSPDQLAHPSFGADTLAGDTRFASKARVLANARTGPAGNSIPTNLQYTIYSTNVTPLPIIRNEELILLRAEASYFTGNAAQALTDINYIRGRNGLAARGAFADAEAFITELLYQRRYSLAFEGHRWADVRRFGRLTSLPLDVASHIRTPWQPIPVAECDARTIVIRRIGTAANQPFTGLVAPSCPVVSLQ